jgi:hypothetical protein
MAPLDGGPVHRRRGGMRTRVCIAELRRTHRSRHTQLKMRFLRGLAPSTSFTFNFKKKRKEEEKSKKRAERKKQTQKKKQKSKNAKRKKRRWR